jgi:hypothetical protein
MKVSLVSQFVPAKGRHHGFNFTLYHGSLPGTFKMSLATVNKAFELRCLVLFDSVKVCRAPRRMQPT